KLKGLEKAFADFLYGNEKLALWENATLGLISEPEESKETFLERCRKAAEAAADTALAEEKVRYEPRFKKLNAELTEEKPEPKPSGAWLPDLTWSLFSVVHAPAKAKLSTKDQEKLKKLEAEWRAKREEIASKYRSAAAECESLLLTPRRADVRVTHFGLAW